jgi:hypothetical protein
MFLNFKKIFKKVIPIIILITIGYFFIREVSILKKPNKNYIHNKKQINKETIKKFQNLLEEIFSKNSTKNPQNNESTEFIMCIINKYAVLKEIKENEQKLVRKLLFSSQQNINLTFIFDLMKDYQTSCVSLCIDVYTLAEKKEIINYLNKKKKKIIYNVVSTHKDLMEKLNKLNSIEKDKFINKLSYIYILCDPLKKLLKNEEFQIFIEEHIEEYT